MNSELFCCLSHPVYSNLLQQPKQTKMAVEREVLGEAGQEGGRIIIVVSFVHISLDMSSARLQKIIKKKNEDEDDEKENKKELKEKVKIKI